MVADHHQHQSVAGCCKHSQSSLIREQRCCWASSYLSSTTITDKHKLEGGDLLGTRCLGHGCVVCVRL